MAKNVREIYETCRKLVKQAEAKAAKNEKIDDSIIETLTAAYKDLIEFEKFYLIKCQDKFWGTLLITMDIDIDFKQRGAMDIKFTPSSTSLTINPMFCADYTFPEFTGAIVNELLKIVYLHPAEYAKHNKSKDDRTHEKLDKASSAASSSILKSDIRLAPGTEYGNNANGLRIKTDDLYTTTSLKNDANNANISEKMPMEFYYRIIDRLKDQNSPSGGGGNGNGINISMPGVPGSGNGTGDGKGSDSDDDNNEQPSNNPNVTTKGNPGDGTQTHSWEGQDEDDVKDHLTNMVSNAYNALDERSRGYIPTSILSQIKALLEPPQIPWQQKLKKLVGTIPVPYRKTRKRLNRRQPERPDLCGKLPKRTINIVCAFDTSGSMSDNDLKYCLNEVFNIIKVYEGYKVTIIECDAEIQRVYQAKNMEQVQTKMRGRGGTSFIPVIKYINGEKPYDNHKKYPDAGKYKDALFIYFTDGYGDDAIPKPKTYRNMWVVMNDAKALSVKNPYGDVVSIRTDKKFMERR